MEFLNVLVNPVDKIRNNLKGFPAKVIKTQIPFKMKYQPTTFTLYFESFQKTTSTS